MLLLKGEVSHGKILRFINDQEASGLLNEQINGPLSWIPLVSPLLYYGINKLIKAIK